MRDTFGPTPQLHPKVDDAMIAYELNIAAMRLPACALQTCCILGVIQPVQPFSVFQRHSPRPTKLLCRWGSKLHLHKQ